MDATPASPTETISQSESRSVRKRLPEILEAHRKWRAGEDGGDRYLAALDWLEKQPVPEVES